MIFGIRIRMWRFRSMRRSLKEMLRTEAGWRPFQAESGMSGSCILWIRIGIVFKFHTGSLNDWLAYYREDKGHKEYY